MELFNKFSKSRWISLIRRTLPRGKTALGRSVFPDVLADLTAMHREMLRVMEENEPRFLGLGSELQRLYVDAEKLSHLAVETARNMGRGEGEERGFLSNIDALVSESLELLDGYRSEIALSLKHVSASFGYLGKLVSLCPKIRKTGMTLNVIGLNIAVESSRSAESVEMFVAFTDEIRILSRNISTISEDILEDSSRTRGHQAEADEEIHRGLDEYSLLYDHAEQVVQSAVAKIRRIMEMSVDALERLNRHSREISHHVGEVVVAIQIHDIAQQKIKVILGEITEVGNMLSHPSEDSWKSQRMAHDVLLHQETHLASVIGEIRSAHGKSRGAFEKISRQLGDLTSDISVLDGAGDSDRVVDHHITSLHTGLEQLRELLSRGSALERRIRETTEQVTETASHLSKHIEKIRSISMELHLKALNAVVKSARLHAEGRALEILAQEVSKLSHQSDQFVMDVVRILESLVSLSRQMDARRSHAEENDEQERIRGGLKQISAHYESFKSESDMVLRRSRTLQSEVEKTGSELGFLLGMADDLENFLDRLTRSREKVGRGLPAEERRDIPVPAELPPVAAAMPEDMEGDIFFADARESGGAPADDDEETGLAEAIDDLWGEDEPKGNGERLDRGKRERNDASRPDLPEPVAASAKEERKAGPDEDLGDNVELF